MNNIELRVGGESYTGWTSAVVRMSMNQISGAFSFTATDPFPGRPDKLKIKMGLPCEVRIEENTVITGYIDDMNIGYDAENHTLQIQGRDVTGDLVDCSHVGTVNEWVKDTKALHIVKTLCTIFDIPVEVDTAVAERMDTIMPKFKIGEGSTCFGAISEICKKVAVLPVSYGNGKLTLTQAGVILVHDPLQLGFNVKSGELSQSNRERYRLYIVKGQGVSEDTITTTDYTQPKGYFVDEVIQRDRSLVTLASKVTNTEDCYNKARWEARIRAGHSRSLTYEVQGWLQTDRSLWPLNRLVRVVDEVLSMDGKMLISELEFSCDDVSGTTTRLTVVHPDTYKLLPEPIGEQEGTGFDPRTLQSQ